MSKSHAKTQSRKENLGGFATAVATTLEEQRAASPWRELFKIFNQQCLNG